LPLSSPAVSPLVRRKLAALARRIRLARGLNRLAILTITLVALQVGCFALSLGPGLNVLGLRIALVLFATAAVGLAIGLLLYRRRRMNDRTLAALFERRYPQLGELLLTAVAPGDGAHASPWLGPLREEADRQIAPLSPREVLPLRRSIGMALLAGGMLLGLVVLLLASPRYARFCSRFFGAWSDAAIGYRTAVAPGDACAARGRAATVAVYLVQDDPDVTLPTECVLTFHGDGEKPQRVRMDAGADGFIYSWPRLKSDVTYRVEAGDRVAGPFQIRAVQPVELAGPPEVRLTPPRYVNVDHLPARTLMHGGPFTALQYSDVRLGLRFTAEPARVTLEIRDATDTLAVHLVPCDGNAASVALPADRCGTFTATLRIEGDHGIATNYTLAGWRIDPDTPPHFVEAIHIRGVRDQALYDKRQRIAPDDPLRVQAVVEDAEGLGTIALEVRINDGPAVVQLWADGAGRLRVAIDRRLSLPLGIKAGDRVRFRLRAADNRALARDALGGGVPSTALVPQVAYSPAGERWVELTVGKSGESLLRQEIADQHGELDRRIEEVRQKLQKEHELLGQVRLASHQRSAISPAQLQQLAEAGRLNQAAADALDALAAKLADLPELGPLADHLLAIAEGELARAAGAMAKFLRPERQAGERAQDVQTGESAVLDAMKKLNGLASLAEQLAQGRLDQVEMQRLAQQQEDLAQRIEAMAAEDAAELAKLRAEQDRIAARLQELAQKSAMLREALMQAEAQRLAQQAAATAKEMMKDGAAGAGAEKKLLNDLKQLADGALKLAQQAGAPEMKKLAQESAQAAESARQAMEKGMSGKDQGKPAEAKAMRADALQKLELMQKRMQGAGDAKRKVAQALAESQKMVRAAKQTLQAKPAQASTAMRQAAGGLDRTAQQLQQQLGQSLPRRAGRPATGAMGKAGPLRLPAEFAKKLEPFQGNSWGELPGELKTQLLQDARARFGEDYAPIIQRYFEQIAGPVPNKQP
jgi:hypothetical protein